MARPPVPAAPPAAGAAGDALTPVGQAGSRGEPRRDPIPEPTPEEL